MSFDKCKERDNTLTANAGMNQNNTNRKCTTLTLIKFYSHQLVAFFLLPFSPSILSFSVHFCKNNFIRIVPGEGRILDQQNKSQCQMMLPFGCKVNASKRQPKTWLCSKCGIKWWQWLQEDALIFISYFPMNYNMVRFGYLI